MDLTGKVALITGAGRGIGEAISRKLSCQGANLALLAYRSYELAKKLAEEFSGNGKKAIAYRADVSSYQQVEEMIEKILQDFGRIDILVNNSGVNRDNLLVRLSEEDWDYVLNVNLKGTFNVTKQVAKAMMKQKAGKIINISSVVGLTGNPGQVNYSASKAGLVGFTKACAKELASRNINVNAIAPGYITTEMTEKMPESAKATLSNLIPLQRAGTPEEVADLVSFLVSDKANYITGQVIRIDGGMLM